MKTFKYGPQKLLIIGPNLFFTVQSSPAHSTQPKIDFSNYKYVPRLICLHICATTYVLRSPVMLEQKGGRGGGPLRFWQIS